jgi:hypothetical protein
MVTPTQGTHLLDTSSGNLVRISERHNPVILLIFLFNILI